MLEIEELSQYSGPNIFPGPHSVSDKHNELNTLQHGNQNFTSPSYQSFIFSLTVLAAATVYAKLVAANQAAVFYCCLFHLHWDNHLPCVPTTERFKSLEKPRPQAEWKEKGKGSWLGEGRCCCRWGNGRDASTGCPNSNIHWNTYRWTPRNAPNYPPPPPPLSLPNACSEPIDPLQEEDAAADDEMEEMLPQVTPPIHADKNMYPPAPPPPPINFTDLREPLDLLTK